MLLPIDEDPYLRWRTPQPELYFSPATTALVVVDMQYFDADWDSGIVLEARKAGFESDVEAYGERLKLIVPNISRLLDVCRRFGYDVIYTRIESLTEDGRDRPRYQKEHDYHAPPGGRDGQVLDELCPVGSELVLSKTGSSVFNGTTIDRILRNAGVENIIFTGVSTSGCVSSAVRDASDLGYLCTVVEDACGAFVDEMHWSELRVLRGLYSRVNTTDAVIERLGASARQNAKS